MNINIEIEELKISVRLNDSVTAQKLWEALPVEGEAKTWGDEIYFEIDFKQELEKEYARKTVEIGDIAFWPEGSAFCIFFWADPGLRKRG